MNDINTVLQREREKYKSSKKIEVKNIPFNTALLRERQKFTSFCFIGFISILIYFFLLLSNGTKIIILPEEARMNAKVKSENFFDLSFNNFIYSFYSKPVFSVSSKGYKKITETIPLENKGKFHEVLMTELPGILNVNINNKNENTQWFLDEKFIHQGEKLEINLPAGQYNLAVNNPFFEKNTNVIIEKGETNKLDLELNNINGFIKIDSEPANASVFINKKKLDKLQ